MQNTLAQTSSVNILKPQATVDIPTATAIIYHKSTPHKVLVGHSKKHSAPVLPGGKIDLQDLVSTSIEQAAKNCIIRELEEEVGLLGIEPKFLMMYSDPERDNRIITAKSLKGTLVEDVVKGLSEDELVLGRYGVPDYIFLVEVAEQNINESEELEKLEWVDVRNVKDEEIGGGQAKLLKSFVETLLADADSNKP